jgi:metal-sulfur cluster biosynthetic enzyme
MTTAADKASPAPHPDAQQIRDILRQVIDPEVGRDIVSLGLVYRVKIAAGRLLIEMTMTSPACPMGEMIMDDVHAALARALPGTAEPEVRLVWEPPWNPSMMDVATKDHFGWTPE